MRLRAPLLLCALLALPACQYAPDPNVLEGTIVRPGNFKKGTGVIQSVGVLRGQGSGKDPHLYRLFLRMDEGGMQTVDIDNSRFLAGEVVHLTNDGRVERVTGTSLNEALRRQP